MTLMLGVLELLGICRLAHPLFWFTIATAAFGVAGGTYIRLRQA
jgi:hypothetical protein